MVLNLKENEDLLEESSPSEISNTPVRIKLSVLDRAYATNLFKVSEAFVYAPP